MRSSSAIIAAACPLIAPAPDLPLDQVRPPGDGVMR